jgi:hypothetical protein
MGEGRGEGDEAGTRLDLGIRLAPSPPTPLPRWGEGRNAEQAAVQVNQTDAESGAVMFRSIRRCM